MTIQSQHIPGVLKSLRQWVTWKYEIPLGKNEPTKVPKNPRTGENADSTDPETWGSFTEAFARAAKDQNVDGIGFVFTAKDPYCGVDHDSCRNPETGTLDTTAEENVRKLNSYTEISPSGTGVHTIVIGKLPPEGRKKGDFEAYDQERYFTFTGQHLKGTPTTIEKRQAELTAVHTSIFGNGTKKAARHASSPSPSPSLNDAELLRKAMNAVNGAKFSELWSGDCSSYPSQSEADLALCSLLSFWTGRDPERMDRLFRQSSLFREKWDTKRGSETYGSWTIHRAIANTSEVYQEHNHHNPGNGTGAASEPAAPTTDNKPTEKPTASLLLVPGERPVIVDQAEDLLVWNSERLRIYQRAGELVRIICLPEAKEGNGLRRPAGITQLTPLNAVFLTEVFDRLAQWLQLDKKGRPCRVNCPLEIAAFYSARVGNWRLSALTGIITAPVMRSDGSILTRAGFDEPTGLFLTSSEDWPPIPDRPTPKAAQVALRDLMDPFGEFPFVDDYSKSVHAAAILTAIQRRQLGACPLFGYSAPLMRSGKSLLADSVAIIATGKQAPATAISFEPEEIRKTVLSALREAHSIVNLDNIDKTLDSAHLAMAITQPEYSGRLLGENRMLRLPTNVMWMATGNNLTVRGDLTSRTLLCRIDPQMERPEERSFKIENLQDYLLSNRTALVTSALTILRAYHAAGRPEQIIPRWGGFDDWSRSIRQPLVWAGAADPYRSRDMVVEDDPDREGTRTALLALADAFTNQPFLASKAVERAKQDQTFHDALAIASSKKGQIDTRSFGWWARRWKDRIIDRLAITKHGTDHQAAQWRIRLEGER